MSLLLAAGLAASQLMPPIGIGMTPFEEGRPPGIYHRRLSSPEERRLYWRGMNRRTGYLEVVIPGYSEIFTRIKAAPRTDTDPICALPVQYRLDWATKETSNRFSALYLDSEGRRYIITSWNFLKDRAIIEVIDDFLNTDVAGNPATLTLVKTSPRSVSGVWKMTWVVGSTQVEFYAEAGDRKSNAGVLWPQHIKSVTEAVHCSAG